MWASLIGAADTKVVVSQAMSHHRSPVDAEYLAGDEPGFLGAQEARRRSDVGSGTQTTQRDVAGELLVGTQISGRLTLVLHRGLDARRRNVVDRDSVGCVFAGQRLGQGDHRALGRGV